MRSVSVIGAVAGMYDAAQLFSAHQHMKALQRAKMDLISEVAAEEERLEEVCTSRLAVLSVMLRAHVSVRCSGG